VLDVDGVLTDGQLFFGAREELFKSFNVKDGYALWAAQAAGLRVAVISSRSSKAVNRRMSDLGITEVYQGVEDKLKVFSVLCRRLRVAPLEVAYMGDDLPDLPILRRVGLRLAPSDAALAVRAMSHFVTLNPGGRGAVRDAVEMILTAQGKWGPDLLR
jgi:3-deoxy-D-manno-octulosonate 8-phosphate phosphatase (KDO 8-P phosphatase)